MSPQLRPGPGEPAAGSWRQVPLVDLAADLTSADGRVVVAVDGRSGGGKSTLARRLAGVLRSAVVVGTDDLAWHAPMFGWSDLAATGVLAPFRRGDEVRYRPPAWDERGRDGAVFVPASARVLLLEGVGASQHTLAHLLDAVVWVHSDSGAAKEQALARDAASGVNGDAAAARAFWDGWMAHEVPFLEHDRPWERADAIVAGTSPSPQPPEDDVWVARR